MRAQLLLLLTLAGCASALYPMPDIKTIDTTGRQPTCVRTCVAGYSECTSRTGMAEKRSIQANAAQQCHAAYGECVKTCPTS